MRKLTDFFSLTAILSVPVLLALTLPLLAGQPASAADEPAGKAVFMAQKCNMCHNVKAAAIERTSKSDKVAGPDLPGDNTGKPASFFASFLKQQVPNNEGNKHKKEWKGTDDELKQLTEWLSSLK
jgi:mono/diheme cytochrome c family protein